MLQVQQRLLLWDIQTPTDIDTNTDRQKSPFWLLAGCCLTADWDSDHNMSCLLGVTFLMVSTQIKQADCAAAGFSQPPTTTEQKGFAAADGVAWPGR